MNKGVHIKSWCKFMTEFCVKMQFFSFKSHIGLETTISEVVSIKHLVTLWFNEVLHSYFSLLALLKDVTKQC